MESPMPTPTAPATIMIVDDEPENLNVLEASLSHAGYRTALFPNGKLALAAARAEPPDLVLLDVCMPDLDGFEVCRRFKADAKLAAIPVIFISALTATADISAGFSCGGVDYITKPFREPEVLARVRTHVALRRAYAELAGNHTQLMALERQRDTLVHMMVHDMRSPLQVILGHLQVLEECGAGRLSAADVDTLKLAIYGTKILSRMVSTVIDLSRMEAETIPLHRTAVPVRDLFQAARAQSLNPASQRPLVEQIAESCPSLLCDVEVTARILANLLANAVKYSPRTSEIVFGADPDPGGVVRLWVRDRGAGIPAQFHQRIFEKFGVVDQQESTRSPSTGLGLAFCKLAVEAQGGAIGVESKAGKGSTFWFTLPAAAAPATAPDR